MAGLSSSFAELQSAPHLGVVVSHEIQTLNLTVGAVVQIRRPRSICHALEALAPKWGNTTHLQQLHRRSRKKVAGRSMVRSSYIRPNLSWCCVGRAIF